MKKTGVFSTTMLAFVLLLLGYAGSYRLLHQGDVYHRIGIDPRTGFNIHEAEPNYMIPSVRVEQFFRAAHAADLWIRVRLKVIPPTFPKRT